MSASEIQLSVPPDYGHTLDPLLRACGSIADAPSLDAALQAACAAGVDALGFQHAAAVILESRGTQAVVAAEHPARGTEGARIPLHELAVLQGAARSRVPLQVGDALADPGLQALRPLLQAAGIRAVLALPILRGERLLGWLSLHDTQAPRAFTLVDLSRGQMLARQLAPLVENDRLGEQARAHAGELRTLRTASTGIASLLEQDDGETMLRLIVQHAVDAVGARSGGVYRYHPEQEELVVVADYAHPHHRGKVLRRGEGLAGRLVQEGQDFAMQRNYREWDGRAAVFEGGESFEAVLEVRLRWKDAVIGVLYVDDEAGRTFSAQEITRLELLADLAAMVLANAQQRERQRLHQALQRILSQSGAASLEERLTLIAREAASAINAESCQVLLAHTPDYLTLAAGHGHREGTFDRGRRFRITTGERTGLTGHIAHERRLFCEHGERLTRHPATRGMVNEHMPSGQCCSLLAIPLLGSGDDDLLGLLRLENRRGPDGHPSPDIGFSDEDQRTALLFAKAMQNEMLLAALEERARRDARRKELMDSVFGSRKHLHAEMDTRQLRHELTRVVVELLEYQAACLYDVDPGSETMVITAAVGLDPGVRGDREPLDAGLAGLVALSEAPQVWLAGERGEPFRVGGGEFHLAIGAPLRRAGGEVVSVLVVAGGADMRRFVEIDRDVLVLFADQVSATLQSSILWNWERGGFVRSSALGRIEEFIRRSPDPGKALPALLTGITAGYGLGFNRAAVFLLDEERSSLHGEAAIGHLTESEARRDWLSHEAAGMENVRSYLEHLDRHCHISTPLDARVRAVRTWCTPELMLLLQTAGEDGGGSIVDAPEVLEALPPAVVEAYGPVLPMVLVPLALGSDVLGFVIADNPYARTPPSFDDLKRVVRLVATASAAIDDHPQPWQLFTAEQLGALDRMADRARPRPDAGWNALADVQEQIVGAALAIFHADSAVLWTVEEGLRDTYRLVACAGLPPGVEALVRARLPAQGGTAYEVLEQGWLAVEEVDAERYPFLSASTLEVLEAVGARSFQGMALTVGHEQLGVLFVDYTQARPFDSDDAYMAQRFSERAALTLKKAQMLDVLHQVGRVRATAQVLARVSTAEPLETVLRTVVTGTREALRGDAVTLYRYDHKNRLLVDPPTADGVWNEAALDEEDEKEVDGFVRAVLQSETIQVVEDVLAHPHFRETRFTREEQVRSCIVVSLRVREQKDGVEQPGELQVGVMFVNFRTPHQFTPEERDNIRLFADQAAVAIHNAQLHEELTGRMQELSTALKRVRASTALATFGIVDRAWRHNVAGFAPDIHRWVDTWKDDLRRAVEDEAIHEYVAESLLESIETFWDATLEEMGQRPVMQQPDEDLEAVRVNDLVRQAVETWKPREGLLDLNLSLDLAAHAHDAVYVNRHWMNAAIGTLIDNAAKAVVETPRRDIILCTRREKGLIQIDFTDTGCGFAPDQLEDLGIHPRSTRPDGEGIGIGLIIAQSIAFTYDGAVEAFNRADGQSGSTVRISLPAFEPPEVAV